MGFNMFFNKIIMRFLCSGIGGSYSVLFLDKLPCGKMPGRIDLLKLAIP